MPQPPPPPEPKPALLRFTAKEIALVLSSPGFVLLALALAASPGLVSLLAPQRTPPPTAPNAAAQEFTTDAAPSRFANVFLGELPATDDPRQYRAPCESEFYVELKGKCWIPLDIKPCPKGRAWEHEGKCYVRALRAERTPTSGEPQRANIAGP